MVVGPITLERKLVPVNRFQGEVFYSRRGVFVDPYTNPQGHRTHFNIMDIIDGTRSIADIARELGFFFGDVHRVVAELARRDLVALGEVV
jgi:aminopeptidase-like protein